MKNRKTHGEFAMTSEICDKQFNNYVLPDGRTGSIICSSIFNVTEQHALSKLCPEHCLAQAKAFTELCCPALPLNSRGHIQTCESQKHALLYRLWVTLPTSQCAPYLRPGEYRDAGGHRAGQGEAAREPLRDTV